MKNPQAKALAKIFEAEYLLNVWLIDNTPEVFEDEPEIDSARALLLEALDLLRGQK